MSSIVLAILALLSLAIVFGSILGFAAVYLRVVGNPLVDQVNSLLPQTQCGQCGYPGCRPYAQAIVKGTAINKCPPGGESTIHALADLLDVDPLPLDAEHGVEKSTYCRLHQRRRVYWMYQMYPGLPGGCYLGGC